MTIHFGSAGNPNAFYDGGYQHSYQMPEFLAAMALNAYEYQCGRGVAIKADTAEHIRKEAEKYGIQMSLHSPYFISLSTTEEEKAQKNIKYITDSAQAVRTMGGQRIVVHSGSCSKVTREEALAASKTNLKRARDELDEMGFQDIILCPETMGKINQLGTLDEVIELCLIDERMVPCIDFGHLNARTMGGIKDEADYEAIFDALEDKLGCERTAVFHAHFSKIEYSKGGEVRHLTFSDETFGPDFTPLSRLLVKRGYTPTIICESAGTQALDAAHMMKTYQQAQKELDLI